MRPLRLLKFDSVHPLSFLHNHQRLEANTLRGFSYEEYYRWLMGLRVGLSDYLTHPMNEAGWMAQEVIAQDAWMWRKLVELKQIKGVGSLFPLKALLRHLGRKTLGEVVSWRMISGWQRSQREWLIECYVNAFQPDVLFIREPCHLDGKMWDRFRSKCVIASFIACNTNHAINWDSHRSDIIFTLTQEYAEFFRVQGIEAHLVEYGVSERVANEVGALPKIYDCTFVGFLGTGPQSRKTELMNALADAVDFKWWGVKGPNISDYPALERTWQGETAGIEMLRIYKQSRVVLNDYVDMAAGTNVNMRTKEVMGVGSMLLTRRAANIEDLERRGALATFADAEECVAKIRHYLAHEAERETVAAKGLEVALREFNYRDIAAGVMQVLESKVAECGRVWN